MIGKIVLRHRALIGIILLAITAYAGYETSRVRIGTSFVDFFPAHTPTSNSITSLSVTAARRPLP